MPKTAEPWSAYISSLLPLNDPAESIALEKAIAAMNKAIADSSNPDLYTKAARFRSREQARTPDGQLVRVPVDNRDVANRHARSLRSLVQSMAATDALVVRSCDSESDYADSVMKDVIGRMFAIDHSKKYLTVVHGNASSEKRNWSLWKTDHIVEHMVPHIPDLNTLRMCLGVLIYVGGSDGRGLLANKIGRHLDAEPLVRNIIQWNEEVPLEWTGPGDFGIVANKSGS